MNNILVIDDKEDNLELLRQILGEFYVVYTASDSGQCMEVLNKIVPDLIILDVMMPDMDGFELFSTIKARKEFQYTPIMFLTAKYLDEDRVIKGLSIGAIDYIRKPIAEEELIARINTALRFRDSEMRLRQHIDELQAFVRSTSHDVQSPVRRISSLTNILLEDCGNELSNNARNVVVRIDEISKKILDLMQGLLELSKVSHASLQISRVDLSAIAEEVAAELRSIIPGRAVKIIIESNLDVHADRRMIYVLLQNLIHNAWKFTAPRTDAIIEIGKRTIEGESVYYVRDNGVGFNINFKRKLFLPFERLHNENDFPGCGIGLSTVHRIIQRHGGKVWGESNEKDETVFYFTVPEQKVPEIVVPEL